MAAGGTGKRLRVARFFGLRGPESGQPRTRYRKIVDAQGDSSLFESVLGFVLQLAMMAAVATRLFADPVWFRWVAGFGLVIIVANLVRFPQLLLRKSRDRASTR